MKNDNLEDRVEKLENGLNGVQKEVGGLKEQVSWLRRVYEDLLYRIKSAGGYMSNIGKKGDDEKGK
jgi:hypothetical protein